MTTVNTKYAIDLSNEGVSLWCRDKIAAWKLVGKVALNAPDFAEQIEALKNGQTPSEDGRFKAQIRIPASEVFVSEIDLKGAVGDALTKRIKSFLEENTPYKYDDLVFDHVDKSGNGKAYIAAVTKETISEAKEFITTYGFDAQYYTTKLEKAAFPRIPKFYDGDKPAVADAQKATAPPPVLPPPNPTLPASTPEPEAADLSSFSTVRSKSLIASRDTDQNSAASNAPPAPPRRISIDLPKPKVEKAQTLTPLATQPIKPAMQPLKMPQGEAVEADTASFIKPKYLLYMAAVIVFALVYWFFTVLFDGKEEIARLQRIPLTDPPLVSEPTKLIQQSSQDSVPVLAENGAQVALNTPPLVQTPVAPDKPASNIIVEAPPEPQAQPPAAAPEGASAQTIVTRTDTALETTTNLATTDNITDIPTGTSEPETLLTTLDPTPEGIPGAQGITLYLGQPDKVPPRREQLNVTPDPLKDILPKMRSQGFETLHKTEIAAPPTEVAIIDEPILLPEPAQIAETTTSVQSQDAPDILALADVSLKSKRPRTRPASIAVKAKQERNSLVAKADPALANEKPKRRPSNLVVLQANTGQDTANEITLAIKTAVLAKERPRIRPKNLKKNADIKTASLSRTSKSGDAAPLSVQKQATEKAAFSKRRISLIGVYGTNTNRRALVRMPSGRYVKIKPGQNFSGWKVAAIGENSVRITKGSRNQILRMPK